MSYLPKSIEQLIEALKILPGIGQKTAERLAFFLLKAPNNTREELGKSILNVKNNVHFCKKCFHFADGEICAICNNQNRDNSVVCVVEDWLDLVAIEKTNVFRGLFHVLGGVISPLDGIGPSNLKIAELIKRINHENFTEIIIATNPSFEGEATAIHISELLKNFPGKITRLARGIPMGGDLEYTDENTLQRAFEGRIKF